jgi:hypothetical protein
MERSPNAFQKESKIRFSGREVSWFEALLSRLLFFIIPHP